MNFTYLLDANTYIQAKNLYYRMHIVPGYRDWLDQQFGTGHVGSVSMIYDELSEYGDELSDGSRGGGIVSAILKMNKHNKNWPKLPTSLRSILLMQSPISVNSWRGLTLDWWQRLQLLALKLSRMKGVSATTASKSRFRTFVMPLRCLAKTLMT